MKITLSKTELLGLIEAINAANHLGESVETFLYQGVNQNDEWENVFKVQAFGRSQQGGHVLITTDKP